MRRSKTVIPVNIIVLAALTKEFHPKAYKVLFMVHCKAYNDITKQNSTVLKGRKAMKITVKILAVLTVLTLTLAVCLTGCGISDADKAAKTVESYVSALRNGNYDEARTYTDTDITNANPNSTLNAEEFLCKLFSSLDAEVISTEETSDGTFCVKTEITAVDMASVVKNFMSKVMEYAFSTAFSDNPPTDEENEAKSIEILMDCISAEDIGTVTNTVDVTVVKNEDGEFTIAGDDILTDALLGGMQTAFSELAASFGGNSTENE